MRLLFLLHLALLLYSSASAQEGQRWTERRNMGLEGPVRSVLTTVLTVNPDPRPDGKRTLGSGPGAQWLVFDLEGSRVEQGTLANVKQVIEITRRTLKTDSKEVWTDSRGQTTESSKKETTLADGTHATEFFTNGKLVMRELKRTDESGRATSSHVYNEKNRLTSEESSSIDSEGETSTFKTYDDNGISLHWVSRVSPDNDRFDRWEFDSEGRPAWNISINEYGELLSYWYAPGYRPRASTSDTLGICRPKLCVSYMFGDDGKLAKTIQHTPGRGNLEPDSEEHYNGDGELEEKVEIKYQRDGHGNWTSRALFVWNPTTNQMIEVERDTRKIEYF
jgi:hypothetical protein